METNAQDLIEEFTQEGQPKRWPAVLAKLCKIVDLELSAAIPDDVERWEKCQEIVVKFASDCGGTEIYMPKGYVLAQQLRDHRIWVLNADHGWAYSRLAAKFGLSDRQIQSVIAAQRALRMPRIQADLFKAA